jgi:protein-S-isoprenylcysteine O-methyltransferase Ste14
MILIGFAALSFLSPKAYLFTLPAAFLAGSVLCTAGILIMLPALIALRGTIQIAPEPKAGKQLVETGIYKNLRHPIYTGIVVCAIGLFLRQPSIWMAAGAVVVIGFLAFKVRFEEKLLRAAYPGYAAYQQRSWGLFPGLHY